MNGIVISQVVRAHGTVLTETIGSDAFGPHYTFPEAPDMRIEGECFGRWRYTDDSEWTVTFYFPNGQYGYPKYFNTAGTGFFHSADPEDDSVEIDISQLRRVSDADRRTRAPSTGTGADATDKHEEAK